MSEIAYADATALINPLEMSTMIRRKEIASDGGYLFNGGKEDRNHQMNIVNPTLNNAIGNVKLDWASWLPFCSKVYNISDDVRDYLLQPILTIPSDLPNRNAVGFSLKELVKWNTEHGMQAYRTFTGKPLHIEHQNEDPYKALGVIVDVFFRQLKGYGNGKVWKLVKLLAIDRTKNREMANEIASGNMNSYSMGAMVSGYDCSYCHKPVGNCSHIDPNERITFYELNGHLVYRLAKEPVGFETSLVKIPAYAPAWGDTRLTLR